MSDGTVTRALPFCTGCYALRPDDVIGLDPRPPCDCGETAITIPLRATATSVSTATAAMSATYALPTVAWRHRWAEVRRGLSRLQEQRHDTITSEAVDKAQEELELFYVNAYHLKDMLKAEEAITGVAKGQVELAVKREPDLLLLADMGVATRKHPQFDQSPRSGYKPRVVERMAEALIDVDGWRLRLTVDHGGKMRDGLDIAERGVAAWRRVLSALKLPDV